MLKLKFNSYFVTAQLQLVLHAENWSERKFRELREHLLREIWPLLFSRFSWICHFRSRKFDVLPLQWCQACFQSQISEQDIRNPVFQIIWQVREQHFAIHGKLLMNTLDETKCYTLIYRKFTSSVANLNLSPCFSMKLQCDLALSADTPIIVTFFFSNSSIEAENPFASVVHPGVESFG